MRGVDRRVPASVLAGLMAVVLAVGVTGCGEERRIRATATETADADALTEPSDGASATAPIPAAGLKRYSGPVEHLSFPPLIADPDTALTGRFGDQRNEELLTVGEFRRILDRLHEDNFVLVGIESLVQDAGTGISEARLLLPEGKKPLVISVEDPGTARALRLPRRLVLDREGDVAVESRMPDGGVVVSTQTETVPILERFVTANPDFSHDGAKGMIALTGMAGVLGYRTSTQPVSGRDADDAAIASGREAAAQRKAVAPVVERLKETGWTFASGGYGQPDPVRLRPAAIAADAKTWRREVGSLVGATPVYLLPDDSRPQVDPAALRALARQGFRLVSGPDPLPGMVVTSGYARQNRMEVDGTSLLGTPDDLRRVFDPESVVDPTRPPLRSTPTPQQPTN